MRRVQLLTALVALSASALGAQGNLARRVDAVREGKITFNFASVATVCGNGETWMRASDGEWYGEWNSGTARVGSECERGPLRVTVTKDAGQIIRIETVAGPLQSVAEATDVGAVSSREASAYLLGLATRLDGRPAREAILPAVLADSAAPFEPLSTIARDEDRPRDARRGAISWLGRASQVSAESATSVLRAIARDADEAPTIRESAVSALGVRARDGNLRVLEELARSRDDETLARLAMREIGRSGDPRARTILRNAVTDTTLAENVRIAIVSAIGTSYTSGADFAKLREVWPTARTERLKVAVLNAVGAIGGASASEWLIDRARDQRESNEIRRRAISEAQQGGAGARRLVNLFDTVTETEVRLAVISALAEDGSAVARTKLVAVAESTGEIASVRRRAVAALERFDGPEVRTALRGLAVP